MKRYLLKSCLAGFVLAVLAFLSTAPPVLNGQEVRRRPIVAAPSVLPDPGGVSPADLSGLEIWLKANNSQFVSFSNNDEITSTWNDSSGNARNATAVQRTNKKPRWIQSNGPNSYPSVLFHDVAGDGGYFTLPNFLGSFTAGDVFVVIKLALDPPNSSDAAAPGVGCWGSTDDSYYPFTGDGKIYDDFGTNSRKNAIVPGVALNAWRVVEIRTASGAWSYHIDGTQKFSTGTNTVAWGTAPKLGRSEGSAKFLRGWVAEIIFYSSVLSSTDRWNTVHTYLNNKYAFSLPTS